MDAIILAGGKGKRLRSVLADIPKPLAPINGKPFLDILLAQLNGFPCIGKVVLAIGYKSEKIMNNYNGCSDYNYKLIFSEEKQILGTGGAIKKALPLTDTQDVLVLNGDSYVEVDLNALIAFHKSNHSSLSIVLRKMNKTERYGNIDVDDQKRITCFKEKRSNGSSSLINAGVYVINRSLFDDIEEGKEISFEKEILPVAVERNAYGYIVRGKFIDIGVPETYRKANGYLHHL